MEHDSICLGAPWHASGRPPCATAPGREEEEADQPQQIFAASSEEILVTPVAALSVTRATPVL
jgi:hypothetical protein